MSKKTTVVNVRGRDRAELEADPNFEYVGRRTGRGGAKEWPASVFGNPFKTQGSYDASAVVRDFEAELRIAVNEPASNRADARFVAMAAKLHTLKGKRLGCWCCDWPGEGKPSKPCHAVVLARLADEIGGGE